MVASDILAANQRRTTGPLHPRTQLGPRGDIRAASSRTLTVAHGRPGEDYVATSPAGWPIHSGAA
ncbi:hypothetical protein Cs7R123_05220 [Catellatospora sp. TT07R-123]|nr:hypothetical protein Cs7R123_05220 [Catellatospora sp. TT07R-123]